MLKIEKNTTAYRVIFIFLGVILIAFGTSLFVRSGLGTDPFTCLNMGISKLTGISFGTCQFAINLIIFIFPLIFNRKNIGIGTLINAFFIGYFVDFFDFLYKFLPEKSVVESFLLMFIGLFAIGYGAAMYIEANMGISPYDSLSIIISEKSKKGYGIIRMIQDITCVVIGFILGGTVGITTILTAFLLGYIIAHYRKKIHARFFNI